MTTIGTALLGPHGEVAEYLGGADYLGSPGALIRRRAGRVVVPASHIGTEWLPVPGKVVTTGRTTGRWNSPVETWLAIDAAS